MVDIGMLLANADKQLKEHIYTVVDCPDGKHISIDTCFIDVSGWYKNRGQCEYELIVMPCDKHGKWHHKRELEIRKYKTWAEAQIAHNEMILKYQNGIQKV